MGAVLNLAPERFRVAHAAVPFVDALTTMLQPDLPLTVGEWEEWGNPLADPTVYAAMRAYAPYENVRAAQYPAVLATSSLHDTRVYVTEPVKWVARLREVVTSDPATRPILLRTELSAGHGGRSGRYAAWEQIAWEWAFVLDRSRRRSASAVNCLSGRTAPGRGCGPSDAARSTRRAGRRTLRNPAADDEQPRAGGVVEQRLHRLARDEHGGDDDVRLRCTARRQGGLERA